MRNFRRAFEYRAREVVVFSGNTGHCFFFRFLVSNESEGCGNFCSMFNEEEDIFL